MTAMERMPCGHRAVYRGGPHAGECRACTRRPPITEARALFPESWHQWVSVDEDTGCWLWLGRLSLDGYAVVIGGRRQVHAAAYRASGRVVPQGLTLDHLCQVRACVNPAHLEPVTPATQAARRSVPPFTRVYA